MSGPRQSEGRATLRDVARAAGVSTSTASLVFSGKGPVAAATGARVRAAATDLGYAGPDPLASSLRAGRSGVVGVLVEGRLREVFRDPFAVTVLDGLAAVLDTIPVGMLLLAQDLSDHDRAVAQLATIALDAVVFSLCGPDDNPAVNHLAARGIPMIGAGAPHDPRVTQVLIDEGGSMAAAALHLQSLGHERPAMVALPLSPARASGPMSEERLRAATYADARERVVGFRSSVGTDALIVEALASGVEEGRAAAGFLLDLPADRRPTAIVAQSDLLAAGVIRAAEDRGLGVPEDLSVTGFDGIDLPWLHHRLTTIDQFATAKGERLGELVTKVLAGQTIADVTLPTALRLGTTTGPPPGR
ncbi:MAG: LacI family DNA-binding transcriptional regulator [Nostocoides sp.]